jgi:hypothetical protein
VPTGAQNNAEYWNIILLYGKRKTAANPLEFKACGLSPCLATPYPKVLYSIEAIATV